MWILIQIFALDSKKFKTQVHEELCPDRVRLSPPLQPAGVIQRVSVCLTLASFANSS